MQVAKKDPGQVGSEQGHGIQGRVLRQDEFEGFEGQAQQQLECTTLPLADEARIGKAVGGADENTCQHPLGEVGGLVRNNQRDEHPRRQKRDRFSVFQPILMNDVESQSR